jgi:hypothetical protein
MSEAVPSAAVYDPSKEFGDLSYAKLDGDGVDVDVDLCGVDQALAEKPGFSGWSETGFESAVYFGEDMYAVSQRKDGVAGGNVTTHCEWRVNIRIGLG